MQEKDREERSIGELFAAFSRETSELVRQEVQLAKAELSQKASRVGKNVGFLLVGGVVAYTGLLALVAAGIIALGLVIPYWLSALIFGLVIAAVGLFLVIKGANTLRQEDPTPRETVETAGARLYPTDLPLRGEPQEPSTPGKPPVRANGPAARGSERRNVLKARIALLPVVTLADEGLFGCLFAS